MGFFDSLISSITRWLTDNRTSLTPAQMREMEVLIRDLKNETSSNLNAALQANLNRVNHIMENTLLEHRTENDMRFNHYTRQLHDVKQEILEFKTKQHEFEKLLAEKPKGLLDDEKDLKKNDKEDLKKSQDAEDNIPLVKDTKLVLDEINKLMSKMNDLQMDDRRVNNSFQGNSAPYGPSLQYPYQPSANYPPTFPSTPTYGNPLPQYPGGYNNQPGGFHTNPQFPPSNPQLGHYPPPNTPAGFSGHYPQANLVMGGNTSTYQPVHPFHQLPALSSVPGYLQSQPSSVPEYHQSQPPSVPGYHQSQPHSSQIANQPPMSATNIILPVTGNDQGREDHTKMASNQRDDRTGIQKGNWRGKGYQRGRGGKFSEGAGTSNNMSRDQNRVNNNNNSNNGNRNRGGRGGFRGNFHNSGAAPKGASNTEPNVKNSGNSGFRGNSGDNRRGRDWVSNRGNNNRGNFRKQNTNRKNSNADDSDSDCSTTSRSTVRSTTTNKSRWNNNDQNANRRNRMGANLSGNVRAACDVNAAENTTLKEFRYPTQKDAYLSNINIKKPFEEKIVCMGVDENLEPVSTRVNNLEALYRFMEKYSTGRAFKIENV